MDRKPAVKHTSADSAMFENVFKAHFKNLHSYAYTIVRNEAAAEEIVQNVFYKLWEKRKKINIEHSVAAYLYRAVYNDSLNYLKHTKIREQHRTATLQQGGEGAETDNLILKELREKIDTAVRELPGQCRAIFQMSRFEGLMYKDIAARLGISVKTVEHQMGKALSVLRIKLLEYLPVILFILLTVKNVMR